MKSGEAVWRVNAFTTPPPPVHEWPPVACDPDTSWLFDTPAGNTGVNALAAELCRECPARMQCLDWALSTGEREGVYGGYDYRERKRIKAGRRVPSRG